MILTIQDLGALGELLGSVAVLATLVYLAMQTRQNTIAIAAQLDAATIAAMLTLNLNAATSTELQEALGEDEIDARPMNERRRNIYCAARFRLLATTPGSCEPPRSADRKWPWRRGGISKSLHRPV